MKFHVILLGLLSAIVVRPAVLMEPPVFKSKAGVLSLILVAREQTTSLGEFHPKTWVYEVCEKPAASSAVACPAGSVASYGGVRLRLWAGDKLKIRLVNRLPPAPKDAKHAQGGGAAMLGGNPTNLHTHGLIVEPRRAGQGLTSYGDYVFVMTYNSDPKNGPIPPADDGMDVSKDFTDYEIDIPKEHPSGLFWFHPHSHGLALNQVSAGLAGIITIGELSDYLCDQPGCSGYSGKIPQRHLILKDTQVLSSGDLLTQQDTQFCAAPAGTPAANGYCAGQRHSDDSGAIVDRTGGNWFFTINGQVYPAIAVDAAQGEVWRITNASGGATYELGLSAADGRDMPVQILSVDGVSIVAPPAGASESMEQLLAGRIQTSPCPVTALQPATNVGAAPLCAGRIRMMPSSRVEIWVTYRDAAGAIAAPPVGATAVLRTYGFNTGSQGDTWPAVALAPVQFQALPPKMSPPVSSLGVKGQALSAMLPGGVFAASPSIKVPGVTSAVSVEALKRIAAMKQGLSDPSAPYLLGSAATTTELRKLSPASLTALEARVSKPPDSSCLPLAPGHVRRIFFGIPDGNPDGFGLGYQELDEKGDPVPDSLKPITPFDPMSVAVCLPLGPENQAVSEHWQLLNLAGEDHNFHVHQTKFQVLPPGASAASIDLKRGAVQLDNVPVPTNRAQPDGSCDGSLQKWKDRICKPIPVDVLIPFTQLGDFVFHCHILEHEDGGMMAKIRVIAR